MSFGSAAEFEFVAYDGTPSSTGPMTVTVDAREIRWTSPKTSGRVGYQEIAAIELILGDPDPDERDDICIISRVSGIALKVYCEARRSAFDKPLRAARRQAYSRFLQLLHERLSAEDRRRIAFKTDGKLTEKAQRYLVGGWLASSIVVITLLIAIGHPMALGFGYLIFLIAYCLAIFRLIPKEPRTYCPDPIDERFLPR